MLRSNRNNRRGGRTSSPRFQPSVSSGIYATTSITSLSRSTDRDYVPTSVGSVTVPLPKPIQSTDSDVTMRWKASSGFELIQGIDHSKVSERDKLQALGFILGCQTQVTAETSKWIRHLDTSWQNPSNPNFTVIGYFNSAGAPINNAGLPATPSILKPIDGVTSRSAADRRPADVAYAHIRCSFVFRDVAPDYTNRLYSRHDFEFMVHLPQETHDTPNGNGVMTSVTTFWGVDDIRTLSAEDFHAQILSRPPFQQWPLQITAAVPPATKATTDGGASYSTVKNDILRVMFTHNKQSFFSFVIPSYTSEPFDQVSSILQTSPDTAGNLITLPFSEYHKLMMSAAQPWGSFESLPVDLHGVTFRNADVQVKSQLQLDGYKHHLTNQPLHTDHQFRLMRELFEAGTLAERSIQHQDKNMSKYLERTGLASAHLTTAASFKSQAERTLEQYSGSGHANGTCFHPDCRSKSHHWGPSCPYYNEPGADKTVAKVKKKFYDARREARKEKRQSNRKTFRSMNAEQRTAFVEDLSSDDINAIRSIRASIASRSANPDASKSSDADSDVEVFTLSATIFLNPTTSAGPIPVKIDPALPCFSLRFGTSRDTPKTTVTVRTLADTGAALSAGNLQFWLVLLQEFPNIVNKIFVARGDMYTPIRLGGIVKQDDQPVTTDLPVAFELITPYWIGDPSKPKRVMIRIACGRDVSANLIVGMPFLKPLGGIVDLNDNVLELPRILDENDRLHPLQFASPHLCIPSADRVRASSNVNKKEYREVLDELAKLHSVFVASAPLPPPTPSPSALRSSTANNDSASPALQLKSNATPSDRSPFVSPASQFVDEDDSVTFGEESAASSLIRLSSGSGLSPSVETGIEG